MFFTRFCDRFSVKLPIVQAGMAGNITSPQMVAAVSEAGGLGTLAGSYVKPDALRRSIREIKELTNQPFAVNLLLYDQPKEVQLPLDYAQWLNAQRKTAGLSEWSGELPGNDDDIDGCFQVILEEEVPIFSFAFSLPGEYGKVARQAGMKLIGTATTLAEALALREAGVDAIVAQGAEAGGHRGTFAIGDSDEETCVGTLPLTALIAAEITDVPVIAAGGIMDGRGLVAALSLGADGVQLGTRFLACRESTAHPMYKKRLLEAKETDTRITRAFSGRPARGLNNLFMQVQQESGVAPLPYPLQNGLTREIRSQASKSGNSDYMSLWAGQGVAMLHQEENADRIVKEMIREATEAAARIASLHQRMNER